MATPIKQTLESTKAKRTSVIISGPAYMVAVGGAPRGSKAKTRKYVISISKRNFGVECQITSRYLGSSIGSCHDLCKYGKKDEPSEVTKPFKMIKIKPNPNTCVRDDPVEVIKQQNSLPLKKIGLSDGSLSANGKSAQNELNMTKNHVKEKSVSSSTLDGSSQLYCQFKIRGIPKVNRNGSLPRNRRLVTSVKNQNKMTKNKINQLIPENVTEMIKHKAKTAELEFVPLTVEIMESPPPTVTTESTNLLDTESSQPASDNQVLEEQCEETNNEEVLLSEVDYKGNSNSRVLIREDGENRGLKLQFRRGKVVEILSEDEELKFRRGKVVEDNADGQTTTRISFKKKFDEARNDCEHVPETVTLKHQEMERKEAQELLNRVIEETACKLVGDRKTKVRALVGAFESVISLHDEQLLTRSSLLYSNYT